MVRPKAEKDIETRSSRRRDKSGFDDRLAQAEARLRRGSAIGDDEANAPDEAGNGGSASLFGFAARIGTEMVAALAVGALIGYGLDRLFGFRALFLIVFALAGGAAGTLNVLRAAEKFRI